MTGNLLTLIGKFPPNTPVTPKTACDTLRFVSKKSITNFHNSACLVTYIATFFILNSKYML